MVLEWLSRQADVELTDRPPHNTVSIGNAEMVAFVAEVCMPGRPIRHTPHAYAKQLQRNMDGAALTRSIRKATRAVLK